MDHDQRDARLLTLARAALFSALALYAGTAIWVLAAGPDRVVARFAADGTPVRFDTAESLVIALSLTVVLLSALFLLVPTVVRRAPAAVLNVPRQALWESSELRPVLARRVGADLALIGALTVLLLTGMLVLSAAAGAGFVVPTWLLPAMTGGFLVAIAIIVVAMYRGSRYLPPEPAGR